jgi:stalled ribosome rescue protein Dom34
MPTSHHAAVWLDHNEARVFHTTAILTLDETVIESPKAHTQLHRKSGGGDGQRAAEDQHYYRQVAEALADATDVLVLGPATAKLELIKYAHKHDPKLAAKIVGVETVDHPTDRQLAAHVRKYFKDAEARSGT